MEVDHMKAGDWRLQSGSLPGVEVGQVVAVDITAGEYVFSKEGGGQVATLPVAKTTEDLNATSGCVDLRNPEAGISLTLSPDVMYCTPNPH
jgi:hypothetical protein